MLAWVTHISGQHLLYFFYLFKTNEDIMDRNLNYKNLVLMLQFLIILLLQIA
jgi:hypothetical protein